MSYSQEYKQFVFEEFNKIKSLIEKIHEKESQKQIHTTITSLIHAAKLEGHSELQMFGGEIRSILNSLIIGALSPSLEIKNIMIDSLAHLEYNLANNEMIVDSVIFKRLKNLPKLESINENDYFFTKELTVLYVDSDKFAHPNIQKNSKNLKLESCLSGKKALEILASKSFDIVLCDLRLADVDAYDIIKQYSGKIPIVAISSSEDLKFAHMALAAGAIDYIVKSDVGIKWIPRTLHTAFQQWKQPNKPSDLKPLLEDTRTVKIIKYMMSNQQGLRQRVVSKIDYDAQLDEALDGDYGIFDSLATAGIVVKTPTEVKPSCPQCKSVNISAHYLCQKCNSSNFVQRAILEHNNCGHTDLESNFQSGGKLVCPKCNKELKLIGVDYFKTESAYRCKECNNIFTNPLQTYSCNSCDNQSFKFSEAQWTQIYNYTINPAKIAELNRNIVSLKPITDFLEKNDFEVRHDGKVETEHEKFGPFDLIAKKQKYHILILVLGSDIEENMNMLTKLDSAAKTLDGINSKFAIMFSEPKEVTRNLMEKFDIMPVVVKKEDELLAKFKENLMFNV